MSRAPISNASAALGKRSLGCEIAAEDYVTLANQAACRNLAPGAMLRLIVTTLAQRPEMIATILDKKA